MSLQYNVQSVEKDKTSFFSHAGKQGICQLSSEIEQEASALGYCFWELNPSLGFFPCV